MWRVWKLINLINIIEFLVRRMFMNFWIRGWLINCRLGPVWSPICSWIKRIFCRPFIRRKYHILEGLILLSIKRSFIMKIRKFKKNSLKLKISGESDHKSPLKQQIISHSHANEDILYTYNFFHISFNFQKKIIIIRIHSNYVFLHFQLIKCYTKLKNILF